MQRCAKGLHPALRSLLAVRPVLNSGARVCDRGRPCLEGDGHFENVGATVRPGQVDSRSKGIITWFRWKGPGNVAYQVGLPRRVTASVSAVTVIVILYRPRW